MGEASKQVPNNVFNISFLVFKLFRIWITDPQKTNPEYLNDTNNAGYEHPIKTRDSRIGRFHWSDLEWINNSTAQIPHFGNIQDLSSESLLSIFNKNMKIK
jgi:hypothetical protein